MRCDEPGCEAVLTRWDVGNGEMRYESDWVTVEGEAPFPTPKRFDYCPDHTTAGRRQRDLHPYSPDPIED